MTKIETLTIEQRELLAKTYADALAVGRTTEPIDHPEVERVITTLYARLGKPAPMFLKFSSPPMCLFAYLALANAMKDERLGDQLWDQLWDQLRDQLSRFSEGNHWASVWVWSAYGRQIGVRFTEDQNEHLDLWMSQWRHAHWWLAYEGVVLLSERPTACNVDAEGRLHCENGPALGYGDGYGVWSWHGTRVTQQIIENPETLTVDQIKSETNAEVRRVMLTRYGEARYLQDIGASVVNTDEFGSLYRADLVGDEPLEMVRVLNSTPEPDGSIKTYWLRVEPGSKTAQEAIASTWRYPDGSRVFQKAQDYAPVMET